MISLLIPVYGILIYWLAWQSSKRTFKARAKNSMLRLIQSGGDLSGAIRELDKL